MARGFIPAGPWVFPAIAGYRFLPSTEVYLHIRPEHLAGSGTTSGDLSGSIDSICYGRPGLDGVCDARLARAVGKSCAFPGLPSLLKILESTDHRHHGDKVPANAIHQPVGPFGDQQQRWSVETSGTTRPSTGNRSSISAARKASSSSWSPCSGELRSRNWQRP